MSAALALAGSLALAACAVRGPAVGPSAGAAGSAASAGSPASSGAAQPPAPSPGQPNPPSPRQFRLGPAASALVAQAHTQANGGEYAAAGATIERALRIEPDNPLLWIELGRVQMAQGNASQADGMGRKALALATGDPTAQASAWSLIAESLRARGRNPEAAEAEQRAASLTPH
jgi:Tfp pilus assembly protein PilF